MKREENSAAEEREFPPPVEEESSDDFEFAFCVSDVEDFPAITADEIFSNGQIRPIYPLFGRDLHFSRHDDVEKADDGKKADGENIIRLPLGRLLIEERESCSRSGSTSSSSSTAEDLDGVAPESYCVWTPDRCRKSSSTGSSIRLRLRDLVVGRSHSDGKEKFVFLAAEKPKAGGSPSRGEGKKGSGNGKGGKHTEMDMVTAHQLFYGGGGGGGGQGVKGGRRSFLPYKQDLVGLFVNVNGISRTHHPF